MLIVTGTVELDATKVEVMKTAATEMARATRHEPGCRVYAFWQDIERPNRFRVYEEWDDAASLKAHGETAHMASFRAALAGAGVLSRDIYCFEPGPMTRL